MAAQTQVLVAGGLLKILGEDLNKAVEVAVPKAIKTGFRNLPAGIKNGIAKLDVLDFRLYGDDTTAKKLLSNGTLVSAKGMPYLKGEGVVYQPRVVETKEGPVEVYNLRTSVLINMFPTKSSFGDQKVTDLQGQVDNALDIMKKLTSEEFVQELWNQGTQLEDIAAAVLTSGADGTGPLFVFETRYGKEQKPKPGEEKKEPKVFESWFGVKGVPADFSIDENNEREDGSDEVVTTSRITAPVTRPSTKPQTNGTQKPAATPVRKPAQTATATFSDQDDLDALLARCKAKDAAAGKRLKELFMAGGGDEKQWKAVKSYEEVVAILKSGRLTTVDDEKTVEIAEEEEKFIPKKGKTCLYQQVDKDGEPDGEPIQCLVEKVNDKLEEATLKSLEDGETYAKVDWALLSAVE